MTITQTLVEHSVHNRWTCRRTLIRSKSSLITISRFREPVIGGWISVEAGPESAMRRPLGDGRDQERGLLSSGLTERSCEHGRG